MLEERRLLAEFIKENVIPKINGTVVGIATILATLDALQPECLGRCEEETHLVHDARYAVPGQHAGPFRADHVLDPNQHGRRCGSMKLTLGVTVNLQNYENLRLEVEDEVGGEGGATLSDLVATFADVMKFFGRKDLHAKAAIDSYIFRILGISEPSQEPGGEEKPTVPPETPSSPVQPEGISPVSPVATPPVPAEPPAHTEAETAADAVKVPPKVKFLKEKKAEAVAPQVTLGEGEEAGQMVGGNCSICGEPVPYTVWKVSKLFLGEGYCQRHMDAEIDKAKTKRDEKAGKAMGSK
jgi:hypothetical protein